MSKIILLSVVGSKLYGLDHENSDTDQLGVFVAPTLEIAGLNWSRHRETYTNASPEGDDLTLHEIGKFASLLIKGNPSVVEILFSPSYIEESWEGAALVNNRDKFLSTDAIRSSYCGYSLAQIKLFQRFPDMPKPKAAIHALRIMDQGRQLISTGALNPKVSDRERYFGLKNLAKDELIQLLNSSLDELRSVRSVLPESPDLPAINEFIKNIRKNNLI